MITIKTEDLNRQLGTEMYNKEYAEAAQQSASAV